MDKTKMILGVGAVLVLGASAVWQFRNDAATSPPLFNGASTTSQTVTAEPASLDIGAVSVTPARQAQTSFALAERDSIASWNFKGAYTDKPELVTKAQNEISRLSDILITATSSKMILSVGIANQYELLGDGKSQYDYLGRAIQASPENGLPWHNLGVLMERLGALQTARTAYKQAVFLQPQLPMHHYAYIEFLIRYAKENTTDIERAFAVAEKNIGPKQYLTELRTQWQNP